MTCVFQPKHEDMSLTAHHAPLKREPRLIDNASLPCRFSATASVEILGRRAQSALPLRKTSISYDTVREGVAMADQGNRPHRTTKEKKPHTGGPNPKAFAFNAPGRLQKTAARSHDVHYLHAVSPWELC